MTKAEAIQAMKEGKTVSNDYLSHCPDKSLEMIDGEYVNGDGYILRKDDVDKFISDWSGDWRIIIKKK